MRLAACVGLASLIAVALLTGLVSGHPREVRPTATEGQLCTPPDDPGQLSCARAPNTPPPVDFCDDAGIAEIRIDTRARATNEGVAGPKMASVQGPTSFTLYATSSGGTHRFTRADGPIPRYLAPGGYRFRVKHLGSEVTVIDPTGQDGHTVTYEYPPSESSVSFRVKPCGAMHGFVRDQDGEGVGGVRILAVGRERRYSTTTDKYGFYVFSEIRRGPYRVTASNDEEEEFVPAARKVDAKRRGVEASFRVTRPVVSGRVTERSCSPDTCSPERPVAEQAVVARSLRNGERKRTVTDDDGSYKLKLARGRYDVFPDDEEREYDPPVRSIDLRRDVKDADFKRCGDDEGERAGAGAATAGGPSARVAANTKRACPLYLEVNMRMWVPQFGITDPALLTNRDRTRYEHRAYALLGNKTALWPPCPGEATSGLEGKLADRGKRDYGDLWAHAWYQGADAEAFEPAASNPLVNYRFVVRFDARRARFLSGVNTQLRQPEIVKWFGYRNNRTRATGQCQEKRKLQLDLQKQITGNGSSFRVVFSTKFPFRPFENVRGHDLDDPILNENFSRRRNRTKWLRELRQRNWLSSLDKFDLALDAWNRVRYPDPAPFRLTGTFLPVYVQPPGQLDPSYYGARLKIQWAGGQFPNYGVGLRYWKDKRWTEVPWGDFMHEGLAGEPRRPHVLVQSSRTPAWEAEGLAALGLGLTTPTGGTSEITNPALSLRP